jgi:hypothetical protein
MKEVMYCLMIFRHILLKNQRKMGGSWKISSNMQKKKVTKISKQYYKTSNIRVKKVPKRSDWSHNMVKQ